MSKQLHTLKVVRVDDMAKTYIVEYEDKLYRVQRESWGNCVYHRKVEKLKYHHPRHGNAVKAALQRR